MGCDIHMHTEVKINGKWHHYGSPNIRRNYELFSLLAGVRDRCGEIEPISQPRGIPEDATELTRFMCDRDGKDGHSHSWISAEEMVIVDRIGTERKWFDAIHGVEGAFGYLFGNGWAGFSQFPDERPAGLEDVRWVFWFDC